MTTSERQDWERLRAKGHARFILRSFLRWGVPMCVVQFLATFLYAVVRGEPVTLFPIFPWPVVNIIFLVMFWIFGFGYLMGEGLWQKHESAYQKKEGVV